MKQLKKIDEEIDFKFEHFHFPETPACDICAGSMHPHDVVLKIEYTDEDSGQLLDDMWVGLDCLVEEIDFDEKYPDLYNKLYSESLKRKFNYYKRKTKEVEAELRKQEDG